MKPLNKILISVASAASAVLFNACFSGSSSSAGGEVTGVAGTSWAEPTPYGMVLVN